MSTLVHTGQLSVCTFLIHFAVLTVRTLGMERASVEDFFFVFVALKDMRASTAKKDLKCRNCWKAPNIVFYTKEKKYILKIKTENKVSYSEARKKWSFIASDKTLYASVAKRACLSFTVEMQTVTSWKEDIYCLAILPIEVSTKMINPSKNCLEEIKKDRAKKNLTNCHRLFSKFRNIYKIIFSII